MRQSVPRWPWFLAAKLSVDLIDVQAKWIQKVSWRIAHVADKI
jgi:hypothetical protein